MASTPLLPRASISTSVQSFLNPQFFWRTGSLLVASGMATGAFSAHGLKSIRTPEQVHAWETAANYAIYNGLALLALSLHPKYSSHKSGLAILIGAGVFSSSIMLLVLDRDRFKPMGPITPLGGTLMMAGYVALAF